MKKRHIIALSAIIACFMIFTGCLHVDLGSGDAVPLTTPEPSQAAEAEPDSQGYDLEILDYQADIAISTKNVWKVKESITVLFNKELHGIFQDIPVKGSFNRLVGSKNTEYKYDIRISNVKVENHPFTAGPTQDGTEMSITIGDMDKLVRGVQEYTITYTADMGDDGIKDFDEVYTNLLGVTWGFPIRQAEFTILMPKPFNMKDILFTCGKVGEMTDSGVAYRVDGNTINAHTTRTLEPFECVALHIELPEGYFKGESVRERKAKQ